MRPAPTRLAVAVAAGLLACGCASFQPPRPFRGTAGPRPDVPVPGDPPRVPVEDQQRRARIRYALPEDDFRIGPRTFADRPGPVAGGSAPGGRN